MVAQHPMAPGPTHSPSTADAMPEVDGVKHSWVDANGLRTHVAEAGAGQPVVLLHGWPQHWYCWRHLIPRLAGSYRVICPDLRGHGWTEAPRTGYEKEQLATDVLALLDALDLKRVSLVGHDWGGFAGFLMCLREPERIVRYLALNIIHPWPTVDAANLWRLSYQLGLSLPATGSIRARVMPGLVRDALRRSAAHPGTFTREDLEVFAGRFSDPARANATARIYRTSAFKEGPALARGRYDSPRLRTPTLLLFGERDLVISTRMLQGFESHADDMRLELVPEAGHFIAEDCPDLVATRALEFLGG